MPRHVIDLPREQALRIGQETVRIIENGEYVAPSGKRVRVGGLIRESVTRTESYPPGAALTTVAIGTHATQIAVANETTLAAAVRLLSAGHRTAVLNFASSTSPGGGFLSGARAQEEYLARSSGLYACICDNPMYAFHRARHDSLYTNYALYSPEVPVFRADDGSLLETPYMVGIITSPAVNASALPRSRHAEIGPAMAERIAKVLTIGAMHGNDALVLGAWGCGAFENDGHQIAGLFEQALIGAFHGVFVSIVFAIVDWSPERRFIGPFQTVFG